MCDVTTFLSFFIYCLPHHLLYLDMCDVSTYVTPTVGSLIKLWSTDLNEPFLWENQYLGYTRRCTRINVIFHNWQSRNGDKIASNSVHGKVAGRWCLTHACASLLLCYVFLRACNCSCCLARCVAAGRQNLTNRSVCELPSVPCRTPPR